MAITTYKPKAEGRDAFSPSVNINRDFGRELMYIPTPNAIQVYNQIQNSARTNVRSFCIVGAYGTGKSAFIIALEKQLNQKASIFSKTSPTFKSTKGIVFKCLVGSYNSLVDAFAKMVGIDPKKDYSVDNILDQLQLHYEKMEKSGNGLLLVIDEFGKFLEYAAKHNPERELYFIQQLAEWANDSRKNIIFVTTLHNDFNGYSRSLSKSQQNEWDKVKGRLKEITFNEPVEQLLFLASERISRLKLGQDNQKPAKLLAAIRHSQAFPLRDYLNEDIAQKLLPFDILAASVMTLALQKYGQNERSLFMFIEAGDHLGLDSYDRKKHPYYNLSCVHDYLQHSFNSFLSTKYNSHLTQWAAIRNAIERVEGILEDRVEDALKFVKTIGLLNIFASASARLDDEFLCQYGQLALGISKPEEVLNVLRKRKIIRYVQHSQKHILFEGTDLDIELAIDTAGGLIEKVTNIHSLLINYFENKYIAARAVQYEKGTPRFFKFHLSDSPEIQIPSGQIDGYINLIFSEKNIENKIKAMSQETEEAILFCWFRNTEEIGKTLHEIKKIEKVIDDHNDDRIAVRELRGALQHQINLLNHYVMDGLWEDKKSVKWFYKGEIVKINSRRLLNKQLSEVCREVYKKAPECLNEMLNKTSYSGAIASARRRLIIQLIEKVHIEDLGFDQDKFPPEKTIYLALLKNTGIHRRIGNDYTLEEPTDVSYKHLWKLSTEFLKSTHRGKRNLSEFIDELSKRPFKLKKGLIDFWLPIFLLIRKDDFALFSEGAFVPELSADTIDLVINDPSRYEIKAFDIEGIRLDFFNGYRNLLTQDKSSRPNKNSFLETIRPFLGFYKGLNEYTKQTKHLSPPAQQLRQAIITAKDPETSFFEDFPKALNFSVSSLKKDPEQLERYFGDLQKCLTEIRSAFTALIHRFEKKILDDIIGEKQTFKHYKSALQKRFSLLNVDLLLPHQQVFYQRLMSELDERDTWLDSLAQACVSKSLSSFHDKDEALLHQRFHEMIRALDNLCELSQSDVDLTKEDVIKLEITSFVEGMQKNYIRLPKSKDQEMTNLASIISRKLSSDRGVNVLVLLKLLQEELKNEQ